MHVIRGFFLLLSLTLLSGCGSVFDSRTPHASLRSVAVSAEAGANFGSATQLDIVVVFTGTADATLPSTGPDWFRQRAALQSALAKQISVVSQQVPPASAAVDVVLSRNHEMAVAVYAFANYSVPEGVLRIALTDYSSVVLRLQVTAI
ncbi:MAG: hypothetical protein CVV16_14510 [Gammaproteobacteria bacterium HGW-Gammaproteobacteria-6]|jgi:type VI secretion system protein|nr:MAG: hypothetical protein CVV16_14510 [Gammaproteobacteria bacterium HGW-Gammaproteobacteria-6]